MEANDNALIIALLTDISRRMYALEEKVEAIDADCARREKNTQRQKRYLARKAATKESESVKIDDTSVKIDDTSVKIDGESVKIDTPTKEKKAEKEISPQTPYIEKGGRKEKSPPSTARACACTCEGSPLPKTDKLVEACKLNGKDAPPHPTLESVILQYSTKNPSRYPENIIREWYAECEMCGWRDGKGDPINNWKRHLFIWREYYDVDKRRKDPERIPDARVAAQKPQRHKADNWHLRKDYKVENVF